MGGGMFRPEPKEPGAKRTRKIQEWRKENIGKKQQKFSKTTRAAFFTRRKTKKREQASEEKKSSSSRGTIDEQKVTFSTL
jgi:hypothetical protein